MIFHKNRLLADDSHEISSLIFLKKLGKMSQKLPSAAIVIGALRVKVQITLKVVRFRCLLKCFVSLSSKQCRPDQIAPVSTLFFFYINDTDWLFYSIIFYSISILYLH